MKSFIAFLFVVFSFAALANPSRVCENEASMVMSPAQARSECAFARAGFAPCFELATMNLSTLESIRFCIDAQAGVGECHRFASVAMGHWGALSACQKAQAGVLRCLRDPERLESPAAAVARCVQP